MFSIKNKSTLIILFALLFAVQISAQERITGRGSSVNRKAGVHRGNQVRTVFSNWGVIAQPGEQGPRASWKFDANGYVGDVSPVIAVKLPFKDYNGNDTLEVSEDSIFSVIPTPVSRPTKRHDQSPGGKYWTFEPIGGFSNPSLSEIGKGVAMSHQPETWPAFWPDYPTWTYSGEPIIVNGVDVTPQVDWNGYFGRAQANSDQESYFWMDDNEDEKMFSLYGFLPDSNDAARRGQALQISVRGLQWSNFLAKDVVFWLYNIKNDGTSTYDRASFGILIGTYVGIDGDEWNDDVSFFDVRESITYSWDFDQYVRPSANPKWQPNPSKVGYIAYAFLESPGNGFDGIDNDADNQKVTSGVAKYFTENSFNTRTVQAGDKLVLINKSTFARTIFTMPNDTVTVTSMDVKFFLEPNVTQLIEGNVDVQTNLNRNAFDGIDNDLDGLIDENYIIHYRQYKKSPSGIVLIDTLNPVQYFDYVNNVGLSDRMIDEKRDDLIDNDGDWNALFDDVGADGKAGTLDAGEGDGVPTPGEPNFDATDVDESDQIGLTSFQYFVPANNITLGDENEMWDRLSPGRFDVPSSIVNNVAIKGEDGDFIYGSGFFPLLAGKTERFSLALAFGDDFRGVFKTKRVAQLIYNANYNFPRPPDKPTLSVVPGDGKVTLYWDKKAETSLDPTLKEFDFEGYKIYKGTDPDFTDALQISDGTGQKVFYQPLAQFDLKNNISGYFLSSPSLYDLTSGAPFLLGSETGVQNSFIDTDVLNGKTYYYALVAYDRGKADADIFPSENTIFISKDAAGKIQIDKNTAVVVPNAPVLGYVPPTAGAQLTRVDGYSTAKPYFEVIDPQKITNTTYVVSFQDSSVNNIKFAYSYNVKDSLTGTMLLTGTNKLLPNDGIVFNGVKLSFDTSYQTADSIRVNSALTAWKVNHSLDSLKTLTQIISRYEDIPNNVIGTRDPKDYAIVFTDSATTYSNNLNHLLKRVSPLPIKKVNWKIWDVTDKNNPKKVSFAFVEPSAWQRDTLSKTDLLVFSDADSTYISWRIVFAGDSIAYRPKSGDTLFLSFYKPFTAADKFIFSTDVASYSSSNLEDKMKNIKAVPNPYVVTNVFESPLPTQVRGRGERIINFINVPAKAKIHIYTSSGNHIRTLEHDGDIFDGSLSWDLRTKEGLDIAYGVYFYVAEVDGVSEKKFGKLAVIK